MAKYDKFKGKGNSKKGNIVRINKYESKAAVLDLISYIATAEDEFEIEPFFEQLFSFGDEFIKPERDNTNLQVIDVCLSNLDDWICNKIFSLIERLESNHGEEMVTIAVGGGYSSGKSSFLNKITGLGNLLPTGVEPVSIVNTSLTFSKDVKKLSIRGKNFKEAYVLLDTDVLESIQHSSKSKVYVASVLDSILIDIPTTKNELDDITLIDTPGYNNSMSKNIENSKTDLDTALEAMTSADGFIWCIDSEAGTIPTRDLEMIKHILAKNGNKPYIILFTKRDKKSIEDQKSIIKNAISIVKKSLPYMPFSIMGFSNVEDNPFLIPNGKTIETFFDHVRKKTNGLNVKRKFIDDFTSMIKTQKKILTDEYNEFEESRKELSKLKSDLWSEKNNTSDVNNNINDLLEEIIIDDYSAMQDTIEEQNELISSLSSGWGKSLDREIEWMDKSGIFSDTSSLKKKFNKSVNLYNSLNAVEMPSTYDESTRRKFLEDISTYFDTEDIDERIEDVKERYKSYCDYKFEILNFEERLEILESSFKLEFETCFNNFYKSMKKHYSSAEIKKEESGDIFSAIAAENVKRFTSCLSKGVDFSICNSQDLTL